MIILRQTFPPPERQSPDVLVCPRCGAIYTNYLNEGEPCFLAAYPAHSDCAAIPERPRNPQGFVDVAERVFR